MPPRPTPGSPDTWGAALNAWLDVGHNADGTNNGTSGIVKQWGGGFWDPTAPQNTIDANLNVFTPGIGDARWVTDGAITTGLKAFTSATAAFVSSDVGKLILIAGAGTAGACLQTTIAAYVSATQVTTAAAAVLTVSGANVCFGTDNNDPIQSAIHKQQTLGGVVVIPAGKYLVSAPLVPAPGSFGTFTTSTRALLLQGAGLDNTTLICGGLMTNNGLLGYGYGNNPICGQVICTDLTLDGNYSGVAGGVFPQPVANQGSLVSLPAPFTSAGATAPNGRFNIFERVKFYRPFGYGVQGAQGDEFIACQWQSCGQPDLASGATHYDNIGSGAADCIVIGCTWKDSSGNYVDFVSATGTDLIRVIFIGNCSFNHQIGGVYGCGNGSQIMGNRLSNNVAGSGIGYDVGTAAGCKSKNQVVGNTLTNITVNGSGLSYASFGDLVHANASSDSAGFDYFGPIQAEFGIAFGTGAPGGSGPQVNSDGTNIYLAANAAAGGNVYLRTVSGTQRGAMVGTYNAGVTRWQTFDDSAALRNTLDDGTGGMIAKGGHGFWNHAVPGAQPAAPVTLADVIAIIRGCGLSA